MRARRCGRVCPSQKKNAARVARIPKAGSCASARRACNSSARTCPRDHRAITAKASKNAGWIAFAPGQMAWSQPMSPPSWAAISTSRTRNATFFMPRAMRSTRAFCPMNARGWATSSPLAGAILSANTAATCKGRIRGGQTGDKPAHWTGAGASTTCWAMPPLQPACDPHTSTAQVA